MSVESSLTLESTPCLALGSTLEVTVPLEPVPCLVTHRVPCKEGSLNTQLYLLRA